MFRVFREHRLGGIRADIDDCMDAIEHQRHGDSRTCTYRIEYVERDGYAGYQVFRKHRCGGDDPTDWQGANNIIAFFGATDCTDELGRGGCRYTVELV